jgi:GH15 family glucan-1,4-alpha-glucosidase
VTVDVAGRPVDRTRPIDAYGLIGDTRTAALVSDDGAIDWMCLPRFDGDPVFGRLVGGRPAGTFRLGPLEQSTPVRRRYEADTATLTTTWQTSSGRLTLTEGMVAEIGRRLLPTTLLVRRLSAEDGSVATVVDFDPRMGPDHRPPRWRRRGAVLVCEWGPTALGLQSSPALAVEPGRPQVVLVEPGRPVTVVLSVADREPLVHADPAAAWNTLVADQARWQRWADEVELPSPHRDMVVRSLLTLRLLTYSPSGAPVAAPTTSLPEEIGGVRNWDYRFAWPRDASIGIGAFLGVGKTEEARHFMGWLLHASRLDRPRLRVLFTIHGTRPHRELELDGWPGYAGSSPVRRGNGADEQHQLDGYGWVLDAASLLSRAGHPPYSETWRALRGFADRVAREWRRHDAGIWEVRGAEAHHVHSKLMAWLALDRALQMAHDRGAPARQRRVWQQQRDAIAADVKHHGFDETRRSYTRSYGSSDLDAAVLVLPLLGIEPPGSARVHGTIDAIKRELDASGPLLFRYPPGQDGLPGTEGAFLPCAFWLVQALAAVGRQAEATDRFSELLSLASPLGLFAEEMDPTTRHHLGNYPQALTHAALVQAALSLRGA